jgi:ketosteroid isomerase-like protein
MSEAAEVVRTLWELYNARDWEAAKELLAEDVVCEWPHSRERIRGRDDVIELNRIYPDWTSLRVERLVGEGDRVVSLVRVEAPDAVVWAASFFEVEGGRIARMFELWVDEGAESTPEWRAHLVEPLE